LVDLLQITSLYEKGVISENMKKKSMSLSKGLASKHLAFLTKKPGMAASKPSVFKKNNDDDDDDVIMIIMDNHHNQ